MRAYLLIVIAATFGAAGCVAPRAAKTASQPTEVGTTATAAASATNSVEAMPGSWHCREREVLLKLSPDWHWTWRDLHEQGGAPTQLPEISGSWFIHDHVLVLRVETGTSHIPPGLAFTYDLVSVTHESMILYDTATKERLTFERLP